MGVAGVIPGGIVLLLQGHLMEVYEGRLDHARLEFQQGYLEG
jgi:hypothetical protein